jgi:methylated-DNA-[protein]-cysteine S-methyltransferase
VLKSFRTPEEPMRHAHIQIESPLGRYVVVASDAGVTHIQPPGGAKLPPATVEATSPAQTRAERGARALEQYFAGAKDAFDDVAFAASGTPFQQQVWRALCEIPYGHTESYGELAARIGRPGAARAVGSANHDNPIAIAVPCHRVVGAGGALTGYAGGLDHKRWLLGHEGALEPSLPF